MSNNLKKYSFSDLLKLGKLRIPKIQRDYAQGRQSQKVDEIRKVFVHSLLLVVKGKRPSTELDFDFSSISVWESSMVSNALQHSFFFIG